MSFYLSLLLLTYGLLSLLHLVLQMLFATLHYWKHKTHFKHRTSANDLIAKELPSISVIYPVYHESPEVLQRVLEHAQECLSIPNLEIIFVDDGSPNVEELRPLYEAFESERIRIVYQQNGGKRQAQYTGLKHVQGQIIVTVDSDTLINPPGILNLVQPLLNDQSIGAVCGEVAIENSRTNLLSRLISLRYWSAFNLERAAQSLFGSVLCCSGPFSAYRKSILDKVKEDYIHQFFLGQRCTYGDDRHLTNLVLREGYRVVFQPGALASTFCPETILEYIAQQTRWNKSFYREMLWTLKFPSQVHPYALVDMLMQPVLFLGFTVALSFSLLLFSVRLDWQIVAVYLFMLVVMATLRSFYGLIRTRNLAFLMFCLYGFLHVFVLVPVRFKSLLTLSDNHWGTRTTARKRPLLNFSLWTGGYILVLCSLAACISQMAPDFIERLEILNVTSRANWRMLGTQKLTALLQLGLAGMTFILLALLIAHYVWKWCNSRSIPGEQISEFS